MLLSRRTHSSSGGGSNNNSGRTTTQKDRRCLPSRCWSWVIRLQAIIIVTSLSNGIVIVSAAAAAADNNSNPGGNANSVNIGVNNTNEANGNSPPQSSSSSSEVQLTPPPPTTTTRVPPTTTTSPYKPPPPPKLPSSSALSLSFLSSKITGESALIDKDTGRVYWESGGELLSSSSSLYQSLFSKLIESIGLHHTICVFCSFIIWICMLGIIAKYIGIFWTTIYDMMIMHSGGDTTTGLQDIGIKLISILVTVCSVIENTIVPSIHENKWFICFVVGMYIWESYNCPTRHYLMNAISSSSTSSTSPQPQPQSLSATTTTSKNSLLNSSSSIESSSSSSSSSGVSEAENSSASTVVVDQISHHNEGNDHHGEANVVDQYINELRSQLPIIQWKVTTYHYEQRQWLKYLSPKYYFRKSKPPNLSSSSSDAELSLPPATTTTLRSSSLSIIPFVTKKVVTNQATETYQYKSCTDRTSVGIWKLATPSSLVPSSTKSTGADNDGDTTTSTTYQPPFTKIIITKLLVLENEKTRNDYFKQQSEFVTKNTIDNTNHCNIEFTTQIEVPGYKPRILAVNPVTTTHHHHHHSQPLLLSSSKQSSSKHKLFNQRLFWFFTMIGLTFPYRVWFERHCDYLRVVVIKETSSAYSSSPDATNVVANNNKNDNGANNGNSWFSIPKSYYSYWTSSSSSSSSSSTKSDENSVS